MTPQEMHIGIDLTIQKINSSINKNVLPEEKDWFLNREVTKYIKQRTDPTSNVKQLGFQDTTKRLEDLKDLVKVEDREVEIVDDKGIVTFPADYFSSIRFDGLLRKSCDSVPTNLLTYRSVVFNTNLTSVDGDLTTYTISIVIGGTSYNLFSLNDLPNNYLDTTNFNGKSFILLQALKILIPKKLKQLFPTSNTSLYWEFIGNEYYANSFVLYTDLNVTGVNVLVNNTNTNSAAVTDIKTVYDKKDMTLKGHIRSVDAEFAGLASRSTLSNSRPHSMLGEIQRNQISIEIPLSVVLGYVRMTYICQPSIIDVNLNNALNMSNKVCEEVVNNTARYILALIEAGNYEAVVRENLLIE